jgi:hypothetical protein
MDLREEVEKFREERNYLMSSCSCMYESAYSKLIIASFYPKDSDDSAKHVYHFEMHEYTNREPYLKIEGPFEDASDEYWLDMVKRDKEKGNGLVSVNYIHYTVSPDHPQPGPGDGHGGSEFEIVVDMRTAARLHEQGLKIAFREDEKWILTTRNLWSQDLIPKKHRHLFTPNCEIL